MKEDLLTLIDRADEIVKLFGHCTLSSGLLLPEADYN